MTEDPRFKNPPPELPASIRAMMEKARTEKARLMESLLNHFQQIDYVLGGHLTPQGVFDPNSVVRIVKWQNSKGDTLYLTHARRVHKKPNLSQDEMLALSAQIKAEQADFNNLSLSEQTQIQKEGNPKFGAYLSNETLKEQFQKLK